MFVPFLLVASAVLVACQPQQDIDPTVLCEVFGGPCLDGTPTTPKPTPVPDRPKLEDIRVSSTDRTTTYVNKEGDTCKCVPYYLCDANLIGTDANNASVTGWGELDIRFGENECQESVERCCKNPKNPGDVLVPTPDPSNLRGCGYRNPRGLDVTLKGGSGNEALFGEFPWVIALMDANNYSYAGVGVLIHPQVVMTGAHIAARYGPGRILVRAGEWDTQTSKERLPHQQRLAESIIMHPEFRRKSLQSDVALLKLDQPLQLADHINVICLPRQNENFDTSRQCVVNGWGKDVFGLQGRYAVFLKRLEQNMVSHARCDVLLKRTRLGSKFNLHNTFVCAGGEEGKDACQGDGGAPLACPIGNDRYKLTGLVAWGIGCGQKDVPGVYADVAKFRNWVDDTMGLWGFDTSGYNIN